MALNFTEFTFDTVTEDAIDIGSDEIILAQALDKSDRYHLELALDENALSDYTMPNGQTADVYFAVFVRAEADIAAQYKAARLKASGNAAIVSIDDDVEQLQTDVADHEARITVLETP